ncbi:helix-turn-helix domain-containing protein [Rhodococcus sp. IEGM 1379]|uniref:GlxA family transcriptional regulator n=1 Tax=Rhodococcus sp. IEGM 1379 TaxID=3047086 RepID=UPI0024B8158F|nr:helix-turn-helix domain-containing protein [Rhodococcus sp. IEGM 1379]MDI9913699.1 helix-turn-helix domain-containing protein [Rhodococcus sp. IEGM 1379]
MLIHSSVGRLGLAPAWETRLWSDRAGGVRTVEGYSIGDVAGPSTLDWADIVVIPSWPLPLSPISERLRAPLSAAHSRGTPIVGLCLGAFAVADAGFLDGRSAVTHWEMMPALAERHPSIRLDESVLYIDHGDVMTSAGTASAIDACLHLVRKHLGSAVATRVARSLVVAPHREGGQAQYIERPLAEPATDTAMPHLLEWALGRLDESLSIDSLAAQARMSRRNFVRQFRLATGTTPARWVLEQRLGEARTLLETTDWSIDAIAVACGFGSAVTFRQNFVSSFATTPTAYRKQFADHSAIGRRGGGGNTTERCRRATSATVSRIRR